MLWQIKRLNEGVKVPTRAYEWPAGWDLYARIDCIINPREHVTIPLGFMAEFDRGHVAILYDRFGMGKSGIGHFAGVIDADYRGEWNVVLFNSTKTPRLIKAGEKIIQVIFHELVNVDMRFVDELTDTLRGERGGGSSDQQDNTQKVQQNVQQKVQQGDPQQSDDTQGEPFRLR